MRLVLTQHGSAMLTEKAIDRSWVEMAVQKPDRDVNDPKDPGRLRFYKAVAENGGRVLRVVGVVGGDDVRVVTASFDRGARQ